MSWLLRTVSLPYLRQHRFRTSLTLLGIAAGVTTMIATGTVCDSVFRSFARSMRTAMSDADLRITARGLGLDEAIVEELRQVPDVVDLGPVIEGFVSLPGTPAPALAIVGIDVLSDPRSREQMRNGSIRVPDETALVNQPGAVLIPHALAETLGAALGDRIPSRTADGPRSLVIRGLMPSGGIAALFGGRLAVMDLLRAQELLGESGRLHHVDLWLAPGTSTAAAADRLAQQLAGRASVETGAAAEDRARHLLMAIRVFLTMAAFLAVIVGFFIVYHTVAVSVQQRRQHLAVLNAVGVARSTLFRWLTAEMLALAAIAIVLGIALGTGFAYLAVELFGTVTSSWIVTPEPTVAPTGTTIALAIAFGLVSALSAVTLACRIVFRRSSATELATVQTMLTRPRSGNRSVVAAGLCFVVAGVLVSVAPPTLPYAALVSYVLLIAMTLMLGFGLLAPALARGVAAAAGAVAKRRRGIVLVVAASNLHRNPASFIVVVTAIVMALASTLASFSLTASLRSSALSWLTEHYRGDLVLTGEGAFLQILTSPPIADDVLHALRRRSDLSAVQGVRAIEVEHAALPAVLLAYDRAPEGFTLYDGDWDAVSSRFWEGDGVLVSDNLARMRSIVRGDRITLPSAKGSRDYDVLGLYPDYTGGSQLGSIAISRAHYRTVWGDDLVNRIRLWTRPGADGALVAQRLTTEYLGTHGLRALTIAEIRNEIRVFIDDAFAVMYALVAVSLLVSFVGVVNFLVTALSDREHELRTLRAIGLSPHQRFAMIVTEATLIGAVGATVGTLAGATLAAIITFHSVPMVTGWLFLFEFPLAPTLLLGAGAILLSAAASLPSAMLANRARLEIT